MNTFDETNVVNYYNNYIDYNNHYINNQYIDLHHINDVSDNLNIIIKDMEHLDEIKEELTTQEYLDKSNRLYRRYHDLKRRLGN
jgi:hypothetical protein